MTASSVSTPKFGSDDRNGAPAPGLTVGQYILNLVATAARRAADRRRLAALSRHGLEDVGLTLADLDPALPGRDPYDPRNAPHVLAQWV